MPGISNPFVQFGDYRGNNAASDELVTTNYLTGQPDPRLITNEQASLIFKQLQKRDKRTKQRALGDLEQWLNSCSGEIEEAIHLAYIQLYAKLSLDVTSQVRQESHVVLGKLYEILGKRSSKYLKYSVGPWITGTFDPDIGVAQAARQTLAAVFPGDKARLFIEKFESPLVDFIFDSCINATAQTLSDERYITKEDASKKYTRLIKSCFETLRTYPQLFSLNSEHISELVDTGRLYKFFSSADSGLARASLKLIQTHLDELEYKVPIIWKELLRAGQKNAGGPTVALDVIQFMNVLTKKFPEETWGNDRKDSMTSIAQFIVSEPPHPTRFWPLLYNLVLMIPEPPERDLTPLFKPLEKTVLKIRHNAELEESAWGCFVSLAGKMSDTSYIVRAFRAAEQRCMSPNVPVTSISKFLARFSETKGVPELVKSQLNSKACPLEYKDVLTRTHKFRSLIESSINSETPVQDLVVIARADPGIKFPESLNITDDPKWIELATASNTVDAQIIVESMVGCGFELNVLLSAQGLKSRGVQYPLDEFVLTHFDDIDVLKATVLAYSVFITGETAASAFSHLIQTSIDGDTDRRSLTRFVYDHAGSVEVLVRENDNLRNDFQYLLAEGSQGILAGLFTGLALSSGTASNSATETSRKVTSKGIGFLRELDLNSLDLTVPAENAVNVLRCAIPVYEGDDGLGKCLELLNRFSDDVDMSDPEISVKVAVLKQYFDSWMIASPRSDLHKFEIWDTVDTQCAKTKLWELSASKNLGVAYNAALAFTHLGPIASNDNEFKFDRSLYSTPTLQGAILSYYSACQENAQFSSLQRTLVIDAIAKKLKKTEYMLIDTAYIPENTSVVVEEGDVNAVQLISTFQSYVSNLENLVFQSSDQIIKFAALCACSSVSDLDALLEYVVNLPQETGMDRLSTFKCLHLVNQYNRIEWDEVFAFAEQILQTESSFIELPWIVLQLLRKSGVCGKTAVHLELGEPGNINSEIVYWVIWTNFMEDSPIPSEMFRRMLQWINPHIKTLASKKLPAKDNSDMVKIPNEPPKSLEGIAANLLYKLSMTESTVIRDWYRDIRDRTFAKNADVIFSNIIVPNILLSLKAQLENETFADGVIVSVNAKLREIRASRELGDEMKVEVVISLPEQFPGKPAVVDIRNLAAVSEAKRRGWLLAARQTIQNTGLLPALHALLAKLHNYLEGVEACAICYMKVSDHNKLPNKECVQCNNIYHTDCLYQWFTTNKDKLCPMCRNPM